LNGTPEPIDVDSTQICQPQTPSTEEENENETWLNKILGKEWVLDEPVKYFGPTTESQSRQDDWYNVEQRTAKNVLPFNEAENPASNKLNFKVTRFTRKILADVVNTSKHPVINDNDVKDFPQSELERIICGRTLT